MTTAGAVNQVSARTTSRDTSAMVSVHAAGAVREEEVKAEAKPVAQTISNAGEDGGS